MIIPNADNLDKTLTNMIVGLPEHMSALGYDVAPTFPVDFFTLLSKSGAEDYAQFNDFIELTPIIGSMIAKTPQQAMTFAEDFEAYAKNFYRIKHQANHERLNAKQDFSSNLDDLEKRIRYVNNKLFKAILSLEDESKKDTSHQILEKKEITSLQEALSREEDELKRIDKNLYAEFKRILENAEGKANDKYLDEEKAEIRDRAKDAAMKVAMSSRYSTISALCVKMFVAMDRISAIRSGKKKDVKQDLRDKIQKYEQEQEQIQTEIDKILSNFTQYQKTIRKISSVTHREEFIGGHNSVSALESDNILLDMSLGNLSEKEISMLYRFIQDNAVSFRTRFSRNVKTDQVRKIDYPNTTKAACRTGGIPIEIKYMRPKHDRVNVVMFLDISGSCRDASRIMLAFMGLMSSIFPGGTKSYAFINKLYDISDIFKESLHLNAAIDKVLSTIPSRGVYSDYYAPFEYYYKEKLHEVNSESIVLILGDIRNNKNKNPAEYVKAICRKAKRSYIFNTETLPEWNKGDSIVGALAPYVTECMQCTTTRELLEAIDRIR